MGKTRIKIVIMTETLDEGATLDRAWLEFLGSDYGRRLRDALHQHNFVVVGMGYEKASEGAG